MPAGLVDEPPRQHVAHPVRAGHPTAGSSGPRCAQPGAHGEQVVDGDRADPRIGIGGTRSARIGATRWATPARMPARSPCAASADTTDFDTDLTLTARSSPGPRNTCATLAGAGATSSACRPGKVAARSSARSRSLGVQARRHHRRRHRARQEHGPALPRAGRRARDLRPAPRRARGHRRRAPRRDRRRGPHVRLRRPRRRRGRADGRGRGRRAPLTALVNNAAGNFLARSEELSPRAVDAVVGIVLKGSLNCTLACGRRWLAEGGPAPCSASSPATPGPARPTCCPRRWPRPACWR